MRRSADSRARQANPMFAVPAQTQVLENRYVLTPLVALTTKNELVTFDSTSPEEIMTSNEVSGLQRGEKLLGIDVRPATGELYGLTNKGRLYTIDPYSGVATFKVALTADSSDTSNPFTKLKGSSFGIDFNPTVDRLRVTSDRDINLRINVDTGATITDTTLAYTSGDTNVRKNPTIVGSAYTNPDNDPATGTSLLGIDWKQGVVVGQNPANDGALATIGSLGMRVRKEVGFDIGADGVTYATLIPQRGSRDASLYTVQQETGAVTLVGTIGSGHVIKGLAALLPAQPVFAVTTDNNLISFNSARPDILTSKTAITGLAEGDSIEGIDFRPSTGQLFGIGSSGTLYILDTSTATATLAPSLFADPTDLTIPYAGLIGTSIGFDFNPVADRLRMVSDADENLRANIDTGGTLTDEPLAYAAGDVNFEVDPRIVASAYSNNFAGATSTVLTGIDSDLDVLVLQNPPNAGALSTIGSLGVDTTDLTSFDQSAEGDAFAALTLASELNTGFYSINLSTGAATFIGTIGGTTTVGGERVRAMAIAPSIVQVTAV